MSVYSIGELAPCFPRFTDKTTLVQIFKPIGHDDLKCKHCYL